jgi:lipopolysaccharide biosynthesis regulator YciM
MLLQETSQYRRAIEVLQTLLKKIDATEYVKLTEVSLELAQLMASHNNDTYGAVKVRPECVT